MYKPYVFGKKERWPKRANRWYNCVLKWVKSYTINPLGGTYNVVSFSTYSSSYWRAIRDLCIVKAFSCSLDKACQARGSVCALFSSLRIYCFCRGPAYASTGRGAFCITLGRQITQQLYRSVVLFVFSLHIL